MEEANKLKPEKRENRISIQNLLQERIIHGKYLPGQQIPRHTELKKALGVSRTTVQRAVDDLIRDGFVRTVRGRGTFVVAHPPHLCRYGLVFPVGPLHDPELPEFYRWICRFAMEMEEKRKDVRFSVYTEMDGHHDVEDYDRLVSDVSEHRLAGLIFVIVDPQLFAGTPILEEPGIARVAHWDQTEAEGISIVHSDAEAFLHMALDHLHSRGRSRIALLCHPEDVPGLSRHFWPAIVERNMTSRPYWIQSPSKNPEGGGKCIHMLLSGEEEDRPDGLVSIEKFDESITAGVMAARVHVPEDLEVVIGWDHLPAVENTPIPMRRLASDVRELVETYIQLAKDQAQGRFQPLTLVAPKFEEDITWAKSPAQIAPRLLRTAT